MKISPSGFTTLRSCPLRAVWAAHFQPLLPRSPRTRIGTVIHNLWEAATKGRVGGGTAFDTAWQAEIDAQEKEMTHDWKEAHLVPLETSVSDLEVRRLRCRHQLTGWVFGTKHETHRAEQTVTDATGIVRGRIDAIVMDSDGAHLIDLKTGPVTGTDGKLKDTYVQQLKLYAALYHEETGDWPATLTLRTAETHDWPLAWTPEECCPILAEALRLYAQINESIEQGDRGDSLAKPDPDTCRHCDFRPVCPYYWRARETSSQEEWPADAQGRVESLTRLGNGRWKLRLIGDLETTYIRGLTPERQDFLSGHPSTAAFYDLRCERNGQFCEGSMTTGYHLKPRAIPL